MSGSFREFREAYLTADRRVLGAFRVLFGVLLLFELARRAQNLKLFYSNDGVLTNHFVLYAPQAQQQFSLYFIFSTPEEARFAFALTALVFVAYTVGLFTRLAQILSLVCLTSLNARNLFFEDGGVCTMIVLAVWTAFLPLGDRYSVDALRREAAMPNLRARIERREKLAEPFVSLAMLAILLQIAVIYWFNAVHKTGQTWKSGDAVHLVLWQNRIATPIARFIALHEPRWFSPLASRGTIVAEATMVAFVLSPIARPMLRTTAFVLAILLHGSIALLMTLGPFSYAMVALVFLALPGEAFDAALRRFPAHLWLRAARARTGAIRRLAELRTKPPALERDTPARAVFRRFTRDFREALVGVVMVASAIEVTQGNRAVPAQFRIQQPQLFQSFILRTRMLQSWNMFAPDAPRDDGTLVVDARTASGAHIDPFTGDSPDFQLTLHGPVPHNVMLSDYLFSIHFPENERYRGELQNYLRRWHTIEHRPTSDRIVAYEIWWVSHTSPPRGSATPGEPKKELILKGR